MRKDKLEKSFSPISKYAGRVSTSASILAMCVMGVVNPAVAQESEASEMEEVLVTGQRQSILSAQQIKRDSDVVVDSIVAEDIGKLPDRSVTEALARIPGISVSRYESLSDPEHFAGEGSGVIIRGMSQVRGELNGGEVFSAGGGRGLSFDDVPAELMGGVDVYKSPSADMIEGGLGGIVNLRTRLPFDSDGQVISATVKGNYGDLIGEANPEMSGLYSNRWETDAGEFGVLIDLSSSELASRADNIYTRAFLPRTDLNVDGHDTVYIPKGVDWRRNDFARKRTGKYLAIQWRPAEELEFAFTGFSSTHKSRWDENAFFIDSGASSDSFLTYPSSAEGANPWVFDGNGALVSGTITTAHNNFGASEYSTEDTMGVPFGTSSRYSASTTTTSDRTLSMEWQASDRLMITSSAQYVRSSADVDDNTLGLITFPDSIDVDNLDGTPSITAGDFLSHLDSYAHGQSMVMRQKNKADSKALRVDAEYDFDDSIIKSVKAGVRFSNKTAENGGGDYNWSARYQPWQLGPADWQLASHSRDFPRLENEAFVKYIEFDNFQRGQTNVPASAYLIDHAFLQDMETTTAAITAVTPGGCCENDFSVFDYTIPDNFNSQKEKTTAIYALTKFDLNDAVDGNAGVRVVKTENTANGYFRYANSFNVKTGELVDDVPVEVTPYAGSDLSYQAKNDYTHVLPSLNLRWKPADDMIVRFAASKAIWRPEFSRLKAVSNLGASWVGDEATMDELAADPSLVRLEVDNSSNPYLEPMSAKQIDLSFEWYFDEKGGMAHVNLFSKRIDDNFRELLWVTNEFDGVASDALLPIQNVVVTSQVNYGTGKMKGAEVGVTKFFDELPGLFSGLGVTANYTYIDSSEDDGELNSLPDTDGSAFGVNPLAGLSENAYNLILMYDYDAFYSRLAYNWRSEYLVAVGPNGWNGTDDGVTWGLPIYNKDYGQLDLTLGYDINDHVSVDFQASNITKANTEGVMRQNGAGDHTAYVYSQDVRYSLAVRFSF